MDGIWAETAGGGITVSGAGDSIGGVGYGIRADIVGATGTGDILIDREGVASGAIGIAALNEGEGIIDIFATGDVTGTAGAAIDAVQSNNTANVFGDIFITGGDCGCGPAGTPVDITATGGVGVSATITGANNAGDITIDVIGSVSGTAGIVATTAGLGSVFVTVDEVTGTAGHAIRTLSGDSSLTEIEVFDAVSATGGNGVNAAVGDDAVALISVGDQLALPSDPTTASVTATGGGSVGINVIAGADSAIGLFVNGDISGQTGIRTNAGSAQLFLAANVTGTGGTAIQLGGADNDFFIDTRASFNGMLIGSGTDHIVLGGLTAAATGTFDMSQLGAGFVDIEKVTECTWTLNGTNAFAGDILLSEGVLDIANAGAIGTADITFCLCTEQTLRLQDDAFVGGVFANTIDGFGEGGMIDLRGLSYTASVSATFINDVLTVTNGTDTVSMTLTNTDLTGFHLTSDGFGGTLVTGVNSDQPNDFDGSDTGDVVWRHDDGRVMLWELSGGPAFSQHVLGAPELSWKIAETGDFNNDGLTDLLWRNDDGRLVTWLMNSGGSFASKVLGSPSGGPEAVWKVAETGDFFNQDGIDDVLWRHDDATLVVWALDAGGAFTSHVLSGVAAGWHVAAAGLFDGDAQTDILWRHEDGRVATSTVDAAGVVTLTEVASPESTWVIKAVGDVNGDGTTDIIWQNSETERVLIWEMNGLSTFAGTQYGTPEDVWRLEDSSDVNRDGRSDILWRNESDGRMVTWELDGAGAFASSTPGALDNAWHVQNDPTHLV